MNKNILDFIETQSCASVCCIDNNGKPYCFSCFYEFNSEQVLLYFKSSSDSNHSLILKENPFIAGTILADKLNKLTVKGIQFEGIVLTPDHPLCVDSSIKYHKGNPLALAIPGEIWTIQIRHIKMTDSTLGFGKKITWNIM